MGSSDPWQQVDDLDGTKWYRILGIPRTASAQEITAAYRLQAKRLHPDKGGDAAAFSQLQQAHDVLSDKGKRRVYNAYSGTVSFRYVRDVSVKAPGGEDILLDKLAASGLKIDPLKQLILLCEMCQRPSTATCWTCEMPICEFCTMKQHFRGSVPLHWPLVHSPGRLQEQLAKREIEQKKMLDAKRHEDADPYHRNQAERTVIRQFRLAAAAASKECEPLVHSSPELSRFYMWQQTEACVYIAVHAPTAFADLPVELRVARRTLLLKPEGSPAVIHRRLACDLDEKCALDTYRTADQRYWVLVLAKAKYGQKWLRLFEGDGFCVRALHTPYTITEGPTEVSVEVPLPFWIRPSDVSVHIGTSRLSISTPDWKLHRTYWKDKASKQPQGHACEVVDPTHSTWHLEPAPANTTKHQLSPHSHLRRSALLQITIAKPASKVHEGRSTAVREDELHPFFAQDDDDFGLAALLQAVCFMATGEAFVPGTAATPQGHTVRRLLDLPPQAQAYVKSLTPQQEGPSP